jgi:hypothetical protein
MTVWILLLFFQDAPDGGAIEVVQDIASVEACQSLGEKLMAARVKSSLRYRCVSVEKVRH